MTDYPVLILAGGLGTRLKGVIGSTPKPMASIAGKPFLWWLIKSLESASVHEVFLSVGYQKEIIKEYFGAHFNNIQLKYIEESEPLGTGGAIIRASSYINDEAFLVMNGDTFAACNLDHFVALNKNLAVDLGLALYEIENVSRYGAVICSPGDRVTGFQEKGATGPGLINAGTYYINKHVFENFDLTEKFSFETDFLQKNISDLKIYGMNVVQNFIDIGIPEEYERSQDLIPKIAIC